MTGWILTPMQEAEYTPEMRHEYLEPFNAEVLFYPVRQDTNGRPDHSALQVLLDSLDTVGQASSLPSSAKSQAGSLRHGPTAARPTTPSCMTGNIGQPRADRVCSTEKPGARAIAGISNVTTK